MPVQKISGTPYPRVIGPPLNPGIPDDSGLYPWSVFEARLVTLTAGNVAPVTTIASGATVDLLLFLADVPAICKYVAVKPTSSPFFGDVANTLTSAFVVSTPGGAAPATISNYGQVSKGYSGVDDLVYAPGFLAASTVILNGGTGVADTVDVQCWANGGAIVSPISAGSHTGSTTAPEPIILHHTLYTAAILAAGNLYTDATGNKVWRVVGLHNAVLV